MIKQRSLRIGAASTLCAALAILSSGCDDAQEEKLSQQEAFQQSLEQAKKGDAESLFELAYAHSRGLGTEKDLDKAFEYLTQAADKGHGRAQLVLAEIYLQANRGRNLDKMVKIKDDWYSTSKRDVEKGYKWLLRAELNEDESISGPAEGILVSMVQEMGPEERKRFLAIAAEHGHPEWQEVAKKMSAEEKTAKGSS